ncbi:MAG TPA: hypothetical protein VF097_05450 [Actinomycetota bacterium]
MGTSENLEFTDWAKDILGRSQEAARRFNPRALIRLVLEDGAMEARLTEEPEAGDREVDAGGVTVLVAPGIEGLVDVEEPHDRIVLRPAGSTPNPRGHHES